MHCKACGYFCPCVLPEPFCGVWKTLGCCRSRGAARSRSHLAPPAGCWRCCSDCRCSQRCWGWNDYCPNCSSYSLPDLHPAQGTDKYTQRNRSQSFLKTNIYFNYWEQFTQIIARSVTAVISWIEAFLPNSSILFKILYSSIYIQCSSKQYIVLYTRSV